MILVRVPSQGTLFVLIVVWAISGSTVNVHCKIAMKFIHMMYYAYVKVIRMSIKYLICLLNNIAISPFARKMARARTLMSMQAHFGSTLKGVTHLNEHRKKITLKTKVSNGNH